jgi:hypothetical protein
MQDSRSLTARAAGALAVVAVAALAAAVAHVAIDAIGDIVLPHDTYDDIAHDARTVVAAAVAALFFATAARSMYDVLRCAIGHRAARGAFQVTSRPRGACAGDSVRARDGDH